MSCTLDSGAKCAMGSGVLRFGLLDQVFDDDELRRFVQGKHSMGWTSKSLEKRGRNLSCSTGRAWSARSSHKTDWLSSSCSIERHSANYFAAFCFMCGFLWAFKPFVLVYSHVFYDYIRSLRALLGYNERKMQD